MKYTINSKPIGKNMTCSWEMRNKPKPPEGWQFVAGEDLETNSIEIEKIPSPKVSVDEWWRLILKAMFNPGGNFGKDKSD